MLEQRVDDRHDLQAHVRLEVISESGITEILECKTENVSPSGAFLLTGSRTWGVGTDLRVNLFFNLFSGKGTCVVMDGKIVRSAAEGIAVRFDGQYQFVSRNSDLEM